MHDNPYQPPQSDAVLPAEDAALPAEGARVGKSLAIWMQLAAVAYILAGLLHALALYALFPFSDPVALGWLLPPLLFVVAGIALLAAANALARAAAGREPATLAAAFARLRWHLVAAALTPLVELAQFVPLFGGPGA